MVLDERGLESHLHHDTRCADAAERGSVLTAVFEAHPRVDSDDGIDIGVSADPGSRGVSVAGIGAAFAGELNSTLGQPREHPVLPLRGIHHDGGQVLVSELSSELTNVKIVQQLLTAEADRHADTSDDVSVHRDDELSTALVEHVQEAGRRLGVFDRAGLPLQVPWGDDSLFGQKSSELVDTSFHERFISDYELHGITILPCTGVRGHDAMPGVSELTCGLDQEGR